MSSLGPIMVPDQPEQYIRQLIIQLTVDPGKRKPTQARITQDGAELTLSDETVIQLPGLKTRQDGPACLATAKLLNALGFGGPDPVGLARAIRYRRNDLDLDPTHPMLAP